MRLSLKFWARLSVWTLTLLVILVAVTLAGGQGIAEVISNLAPWAGLALALAAYPAGVSVSKEAFPEGRLAQRRAIELVLAAAAVSILMLTLGNVVAPAASRASSATGRSEVITEPAQMSLGWLRQEARAAAERARVADGTVAIQHWQTANRLAWHFVRRTDGSLLPLLFGLIGALAGYWSRRAALWQIQQGQQWALGLFLLVSTYLAGENSYELIVMRSAGPVFFAGDLVLVVPAILLIGLGWPTLIVLLQGPVPRG